MSRVYYVFQRKERVFNALKFRLFESEIRNNNMIKGSKFQDVRSCSCVIRLSFCLH